VTDGGGDLALVELPQYPTNDWWWHILYKTRDGWKVLCDGDNEPLNIDIEERDSRATAMAESGLYLDVRTVRGPWIVKLDPEVTGGE
jgi:hypothetical protein